MTKLTSKTVVLNILLLFTLLMTTVVASAEEFTVDMHGNYAHPYNGSIEDSGGESSAALGQSMVERMISPKGLLEVSASGEQYISFRFSLMDSISEVAFSAQKKGETTWQSTTHTISAQGDDTADFRLLIPSADAVIKAECFVAPMGRAVTFYIHFDNQTSGNTTSFTAVEEQPSLPPPAVTPTAPPAVDSSPEPPPQEPVEESGSSVLDGASGIIVGENSTKQSSPVPNVETFSPNITSEFVLDDSFWLTAFLLLFSVNLVSGAVLILFYVAVKSIFIKKRARKKQLQSIFSSSSNWDYDENDFADTLWEEDDNEED